MERIETLEMISALADGQLQGEALARGVALAAADPEAREAWHVYHLIGDVLRSDDLASPRKPDAFLAALQARLRDEPPPTVSTPSPLLLQDIQEIPPVADAANDGSFRWKVMAGCASVAAAAAIGWVLIGSDRQSAAPQLAASPAPDMAQIAGSPAAGTERGVMLRDPQLDEFLAAHRQLGAAMVAPASHLRHAGFDGRDR